MLEEKDLKLIKQVVQEVIEEDVLPHFVDVYNRFENIDRKFENIDQKFDNIDRKFENIDRRFDGMDQRFDSIESTMVTKDYLESRLADFRKTLKQSGGKALGQIKLMAKELHRNGGLSAHQVVQITS
ncbi:MAG: hypothetical protein WC654_05380 [Patescibacteria group bacterium]